MQKKHHITIGAVQTNVSEDREANIKKTVAMVRGAAKKGARIICLQELYRTVYFPQYKKRAYDAYAETVPGESTKTFSTLARELRVVIIVPLFEKAKNGRYYNSAVVINEKGKLLTTYRKIHIPHDERFYEKNYFVGGDTYRIYKTAFATFAVLICYDQWFPEAARMATLGGADIIFYPTAIGTMQGYTSPDGNWHDAWETVMRGHAIANGVHVVAVNRVGKEDKLTFWGQSFAADAFGKVLKRGSATKEEAVIAKLDISHNQLIRKGWGFFKNRRPDTYKF